MDSMGTICGKSKNSENNIKIKNHEGGTKAKDSENDIDIKYLKDNKLFIAKNGGYLIEYSIIQKKTVHDFGRVFLDGEISSMTKTPDNKSQIVCDFYGYFKEFDISTRKQVSSFEVDSSKCCCIVTHDNKFLITAINELNCKLIKWSVRTKKKLYTWEGIKQCFSQSCSQDNKYQLAGYQDGWIGILDLQNNKTIMNIKVLSDAIRSVAFSRDNQSAFISDWEGNLKIIKWQTDANSEDDFDFTDKPQSVSNCGTQSICLTKDEKYLIFGSKRTMCVYETATRKVMKYYDLSRDTREMKLIKDEKKAIIAEGNGNLSSLDLETLELSLIAENITEDNITGDTEVDPCNDLRFFTVI